MRNGSFQAGINAFSDESQKKATRNVRKVLLAGLGGVISRSPVDTGTFRLNWNVQARSPDDSVREGSKEHIGDSPIPATDSETEKAGDTSFRLGDKVYISNALPYATRIESGWSEQAKSGVVAPTIRELEEKIEGGALD